MKKTVCKYCNAIDKHFSFQCPTQRKPIKSKITLEAIKNIQEMDLLLLKQKRKEALQSTKKKKPINKVSDKQKKINAAYKVLRDDFMKRNTICEAQLSGCTFAATECHHSLGRGKNEMLDQTTYKALCSSCHNIVENQRELAIELGLSGKRLNKR